jgi:integrase
MAITTVSDLIEFYKTTNEFNKLRPNSQKLYTLMFSTAIRSTVGQNPAVRVFCPKDSVSFGQQKIKDITPTYTDKLYQSLLASHGSHRATFVCKIMRKVWYVGKRHGIVATNPFERMGLVGLEDRTVLWQPYEVYAFINKADEMGYKALATITLLCYHLCQRPGDMRLLKWSDYNGHTFRFVQEKTGTEVEVPASPQIQARLKALPCKALPCESSESSYISPCESTGKPYDRFLYSQHFRKVRKAAGLGDHLQLRDLRRTGATEMAEAGCTEDELRSVTGHKSRDVLSIYVRPTAKLAQAGISKRFGT